MNSLVIDDLTISRLFSQIETLVEKSREEISDIVARNKDLDTYGELTKSNDIAKVYGKVADDYSKVCFIAQGAVEAIMDVKSVRREILKDTSNLIPSMVKSYKYRADALIEQLSDFKESLNCAKSAMEARVRYLSTCMYGNYSKSSTVKC